MLAAAYYTQRSVELLATAFTQPPDRVPTPAGRPMPSWSAAAAGCAPQRAGRNSQYADPAAVGYQLPGPSGA